MLRKLQRILTGMEITSEGVKLVRVLREKRGWKLLGCISVPFPDDTLKLSYKNQNVNDPQAFTRVIREVVRRAEIKGGRIGLSIPSEVVKVSIQHYAELPGSVEETERMVAWWSRKSLPFPVEGSQISYHMLSQSARGEKRMLVAIGFKEVIREYEMDLREVKIYPEVIRPSCLNQFNFYQERIPPSGIVGFLGLLENFFTLFVFDAGDLIFYHGVRRGFSDIHFFQDVEMTMELFQNENPDMGLERLFFSTQAGFGADLKKGLESLGEMEVLELDAKEIIDASELENGSDGRLDLDRYASAIGAAQSLVE
ncbi:MAG: hypothetical protein DRG71_01815 [Deltaproteobacteria bacterium]|nr:MAG: hypothetical protein DRG71_01815 [Deltaproteobacteria bacterium]HDG97440.1 hypothetical protein [Desulfobacterales bacterium]